MNGKDGSRKVGKGKGKGKQVVREGEESSTLSRVELEMIDTVRNVVKWGQERGVREMSVWQEDGKSDDAHRSVGNPFLVAARSKHH